VGPDVLAEVPGPRAITAFATALQVAGVSEAARLEAAALQMEQFFARVSGKQRGFGRLLAGYRDAADRGAEESAISTSSAHEEDADRARRAKVAELAREVVGRHSRVQLQLVINAPSKTTPGMQDTIAVRGMIGHESRDGAASLVFNSVRRDGPITEHREYRTLGRSPITGVHADVLMPAFCSQPHPVVESRSYDGFLTFFVDPAPEADDRPMDIVIAEKHMGASPLGPDGKPVDNAELFTLINYPADGLIFDVYQHRDLAQHCIPDLDVHLWTLNLAQMKPDRWATRVASHPQLVMLGRGLVRAASRLYPRQHELTAEVFKRMGHDPNDFVGYRCEVEFPEWRLAYRMFFDFGASS
jgi:hypothetical protein